MLRFSASRAAAGPQLVLVAEAVWGTGLVDAAVGCVVEASSMLTSMLLAEHALPFAYSLIAVSGIAVVVGAESQISPVVVFAFPRTAFNLAEIYPSRVNINLEVLN